MTITIDGPTVMAVVAIVSLGFGFVIGTVRKVEATNTVITWFCTEKGKLKFDLVVVVDGHRYVETKHMDDANTTEMIDAVRKARGEITNQEPSNGAP